MQEMFFKLIGSQPDHVLIQTDTSKAPIGLSKEQLNHLFLNSRTKKFVREFVYFKRIIRW